MIDRIQLILKTKNLTASSFADDIGVQRSAISHILSGRNNPSLDFIQKILKKYPEISPEWLLSGKGEMNKKMLGLFDNEEILNIQNLVAENNTLNKEDKQSGFEEIEIVSKAIKHITEQPKKVEEVERKKEFTSVKKQEIVKEPEQFKIIQKEITPEIKEVKEIKQLKKIERIVIFYSDKTFIDYRESES